MTKFVTQFSFDICSQAYVASVFRVIAGDVRAVLLWLLGSFMQDFRQLKVWQKSHALVLRVYNATATFPDSERFGLTSQMRRAAFSIPSNIAEGCARSGKMEFRQFLHMSAGSASELDYFLLLARDLRLFTEKQYESLQPSLSEIRRMLNGLIQTLGKRIDQTAPN